MSKIHVNPDGRIILVTGSPGFIGAGLVRRLLDTMKAGTVISLDDMDNIHDAELKAFRLSMIEQAAATTPVKHVLVRGSIADRGLVDDVFERYKPSVVVNLAAKDGVEDPHGCVDSNLVGFFNLLEACRRHPVAHLVYASSAAVYGDNKKAPFAIGDSADMPVSLFATTKRSNELMAYGYARQYGVPSTGLRFFTVYGPAERPDMFCYSATEKLLRGEALPLMNDGNCLRDFIHIDDAVEAIHRVMQGAPERRSGVDGRPLPPCALYNVGRGKPENLLDFLAALQQALVCAGLLPEDLDFNARRESAPLPPGEPPVAYGDCAPLEADYGFRPAIRLREGLNRFAEWYGAYRGNA